MHAIDTADPAREAPARTSISVWEPFLPAPSSSIARAARAFGDNYTQLRDDLRVRSISLVLIASSSLYLYWMFHHINHTAPWIAWPFIAANLLSMTSLLVSAFCTWSRAVPAPRPLPYGNEPLIAVIIPTCGESVAMVLRTVRSVIEQDWPHDRLVIVVSDDGHDRDLEIALSPLKVIYHSPPDRYAPGRDGAAKSGNLNSALGWIDDWYPSIRFIETRDADDEVGSRQFLRHVVGQLEADDRLAYVQTIKEAQVSAGDPFNNRESMFYRNLMMSKYAANAVFPCGSGLVWRREALRSIGNFPTWNLVEDLQSGMEALKLGWQSMYLPIVGAIGQHAPEDVPNVYKQRGTWALDTVRLMVWRTKRGLDIRQRMHFWMMLLFYLTSFATLTYIVSVITALLGASPVTDNSWRAIAFIGPFAIANEAFVLMANHPYFDRRQRQRRRYRAAWNVRVMWTGMAPVYAKATILALWGGPNRKPVYKVTRKTHDLRWHWRETIPHITLFGAGVAALLYSLLSGNIGNPGQAIVTIYFGCQYFALLGSFIMRGRHGLNAPKTHTIERRRR